MQRFPKSSLVFLLALKIFWLAGCGDIAPYSEEKIISTKPIDGESDAAGNPENKNSPKLDPTMGNTEEILDDTKVKEINICSGSLNLKQRTIEIHEMDLPQNPMGLNVNSNLGFDHYLQEFKKYSKDGYKAYNDALSYGVTIIPLDLAPGSWYWKAIGVHHLTPNENRSKHHAYIEVLDQDGNKIRNSNLYAKLFASANGSEGVVLRLDKPINEPAGNHAMYNGSRVHIGIDRAGELVGLPTERVSEIHAQHADEALPNGDLFNTFGHHSYYSVFQLSQKPFKEIQLSWDKDLVDSKTVLLQKSNGTPVPGSVATDGIRFMGLDEDSYVLIVGEEGFDLAFDENSDRLELDLTETTSCP